MMLEALLAQTPEAVRTPLEAALKGLEHTMATLVARVAPALLNLKGVGVVLASTVLAEVGDLRRFKNVHHFASSCGAAPVERGSGRTTRWCVNVGGNRQLDRVRHLMALTRLQYEERTSSFSARKGAGRQNQTGSAPGAPDTSGPTDLPDTAQE